VSRQRGRKTTLTGRLINETKRMANHDAFPP
jgi:hypothetical protein